jgi:cytochrome c peroxidase
MLCIGGIVVLVLILGMPILNLFITLPPTAAFQALPVGTPAMEQAKAALGKKCLMCHAQGPSLPYYSKFPIASSLISGHVTEGTAMIDFVPFFEKQGADEALLAKLEQSVKLETMPMPSFKLMHWNGELNDAEEQAVLAWIKEVRAGNFSTGLAAEPYANDSVQPLPDKVAETLSPDKVHLGDKLYHDKRLSGDDTLSCAGCHDLAKGGTDQSQFSEGVRQQFGNINAPTTLNAVYAVLQFWDGRAKDLKDQAGGPPLNPIEMDTTWEQVIGKLGSDPEMTSLHQKVYGTSSWSSDTITDAIAEFEKTLITPNSPLDHYLKGDASALGENAKQGYALFKEHSCSTCHVGKAMGGQSFERPVDTQAYFAMRKKTPEEPDWGRFNATKQESDRYKQKVPSLRNIALTFPYMHDGGTSDLNEVVRWMHSYWVPELNRNTLSDQDIEKIVEMLNSNTGTLHGEPL